MRGLQSSNGSRSRPATRPGRLPEQASVEITRFGACLVATLTRPTAGNRISRAMATALMELAEAVEDDDSIRALALTGAGELFCAGFFHDVDSRLVEAIDAVGKPTIAIINGDALDEGLELALALDVRVALGGVHFALTQLQRGA